MAVAGAVAEAAEAADVSAKGVAAELEPEGLAEEVCALHAFSCEELLVDVLSILRTTRRTKSDRMVSLILPLVARQDAVAASRARRRRKSLILKWIFSPLSVMAET